jgi:hypothetical protein
MACDKLLLTASVAYTAVVAGLLTYMALTY